MSLQVQVARVFVKILKTKMYFLSESFEKSRGPNAHVALHFNDMIA